MDASCSTYLDGCTTFDYDGNGIFDKLEYAQLESWVAEDVMGKRAWKTAHNNVDPESACSSFKSATCMNWI